MWAIDAVALLLSARHPTLDQLMAACDLVPRTLHLAFAHDKCNSLHSRLLTIVKCCLKSKVGAAGAAGMLRTRCAVLCVHVGGRILAMRPRSNIATA